MAWVLISSHLLSLLEWFSFTGEEVENNAYQREEIEKW